LGMRISENEMRGKNLCDLGASAVKPLSTAEPASLKLCRPRALRVAPAERGPTEVTAVARKANSA
jgi:hypothetical protein